MDMDKRYLSVIKACALSLLLVGVGGLSSCNSDDIKEDAMYTFTGETVASFCEKTPELSLFYKLMDECGETALLEVYGHLPVLHLRMMRLINIWQEKGACHGDRLELGAEAKDCLQ